jgi:hypothetical protein
MSPRPAIPLAFVVALGGAFAPRQFAFSLTGWSGTQGDASQPVPSAATAPPATTSASHAVARESAWRGHLLVAVHGTLALRDRPGGTGHAHTGRRTEFGSPRALGVAARRGRCAN